MISGKVVASGEVMTVRERVARMFNMFRMPASLFDYDVQTVQCGEFMSVFRAF